jgi:hypothetical protein
MFSEARHETIILAIALVFVRWIGVSRPKQLLGIGVGAGRNGSLSMRTITIPPHLPPVLVLVLGFAGCDSQATGGSREEELHYLRAAVDTSLLEYAHLEVSSRENISLFDEEGKPYLGFHIIPGQPLKNRGVRAELSVDFPYRPAAVVRYEWRFRLPKDFQADEHGNRWWIVGQWHDQPDTTKGERWEGFPSHSPPILLGYGRKENRDYLGFSYGSPTQRPVALIDIHRGVWHKLCVLIHWSQGEDGSANVFLDDAEKPVAEAHGPNMHNAYQHCFKVGMYRHPEIHSENWMHISDVRIRLVEASP